MEEKSNLLERFFEGFPDSRMLFSPLQMEIFSFGQTGLRIMKSQIVFRRKKDFAWIWIPGRYLKGRGFAPLVLTLCFLKPEPSLRWKQIVETYPGRYMQHFEIFSPADLDDQVRAWLKEAWESAG